MRRLILALALLGAGFAGYRYYSMSYAPVKVYERFAEDVLWQRYDAAAKACDGLSADDLRNLGSQEHIGAGPQMFQTLFPSRFSIESREATADGLAIRAIQTVRFNPAGVESAVRSAMSATMRQSATLRKVNGDWRITAFENVFEKMESGR